MFLLDIIILLAVVLGLAAIRVHVIVWTTAIALTLILLGIFGSLGFLFLTLCWLLFLPAALYANLATVRQRYVIKPLINILKERMPTISHTEREAIEAGNTWWEKDLFCGRPDWKKLLAIPTPKLSAEEQDFLDNQVETVCGMVDDWEIVNNLHDMPAEIWDYLKKERFFGMVIPKEYGGRGFSALAHSTVVLKIATRSVSVAVNTMVPNSLGPGELLVHYGTNEQKEYYLPRLARGEEIPCFALTGPEAGSDAGSITDTGVICKKQFEGKEVLGIQLNWDKRYITLAPVATVLGLAFRLFDPDHLLGKKLNLGITLCLVPTHFSGVEIGNRHLPLHLAFMNGPTRGKNVFIPLENIIGGPEMIGQGWRMLMECLSIGRSISLPALSTAVGNVTFRLTAAYARIHRQFNTAIANFEGIEEVLSRIGGYTYLLEACRTMTAGAVDLKINPSIVSAIAKYHMTEIARKIANDAMDIQAGHAIQVGPRNIIANGHMAIPISITVEGANILTRNLIIFGQGAIRCHPYILSEVNLLSTSAESNVPALDKLFLSHTGYVISNVVRNLLIGLTGGRLLISPRSKMSFYYRQLTRMSTALALLADVTMIMLGGSLKRRERISARLGDILSQLYLASTVLKYFHDNCEPDSDIDFVRWSVQNCLHEIQNACDALLYNFPKRWLGRLLRGLIFPYGTAYPVSSDRLSHRIVKAMLIPSALRDRLTRYFYASNKPNDPAHRIEIAFHKVTEIEPIWKKYQSALRGGAYSLLDNFNERLQKMEKTSILTKDEANALREYQLLQAEIIKVNEFSFDLNTVVS